MKTRREGRQRRKMKIKKQVRGTADMPRVFVFKSNKYFYVGMADDDAQKVLASARSTGKNTETAEKLGSDFGKKLKKLKVEKVVFDRGGYKYHGSVKVLADAIRKEGIQF